jgi:hypothetical protein
MIAPKNSFVEIRALKAEELYKDQGFFSNKVLICRDIANIKKALPDLISLITLGRTSRQVSVRSNYGNSTQNVTAKYPAALIGIESVEKASLIRDPSFIRIPVFDDHISTSLYTDGFHERSGPDSEITTRSIAAMFERLRHKRVNISYLRKLLRNVIGQQPTHFRQKMRIIHDSIALCAIINDPPVVTANELFLKNIGIDGPVTSVEDVNANTIDYYIASNLINGVIGIGSEQILPDQMKVFNAVKKINFGKITQAAIDQNNLSLKLSLLPRFTEYWAYEHEILKVLNSSKQAYVSFPEIDKNLKLLKKLNKIGSKKGSATYGIGYFILTPEIDTYLRIPELSEIFPVERHTSVKSIFNPITGDVEKICM